MFEYICIYIHSYTLTHIHAYIYAQNKRFGGPYLSLLGILRGPTWEVANTPKSCNCGRRWTTSGVICVAGVVEALAYRSMETDKGRFDPPSTGMLKLFNWGPCRAGILKLFILSPSKGRHLEALQLGRKGCPPKIFQRIKSPNLKSQGVSP